MCSQVSWALCTDRSRRPFTPPPTWHLWQATASTRSPHPTPSPYEAKSKPLNHSWKHSLLARDKTSPKASFGYIRLDQDSEPLREGIEWIGWFTWSSCFIPDLKRWGTNPGLWMYTMNWIPNRATSTRAEPFPNRTAILLWAGFKTKPNKSTWNGTVPMETNGA
jgi:hypothetical protein